MSGAEPATGASERRAVPERRRYNRRLSAPEVSPPYYETFDRIASALERIGDSLSGNRSVTLPPDTKTRPTVPRPSEPGV